MNTQGVAVAIGVDVEVTPAASDTAAHILTVVLEVQHEDGLLTAQGTNLVVHVLSLLGGGEQLGHGVLAHGHVVEVPHEVGTPVHQLVHIGLGADVRDVDAGIADGVAEGQAVALQQVHGLHGSLVGAVTTAGVHGLLVPLHADDGDKVLHPHHVGSELLVNEGAVGEAHEDGVGVDFAELDEVLLPHQGFTAGIDIEVSGPFPLP